jgi:membrane protease subunit (stomatin/prohibitin family)
MPLFEGHRDRGLQRLFIEIPEHAKDRLVWKWPDQQIIRHSLLNVDLDYQAVFTNLGELIGVMGPGRHPLDEGASLTLGWLVDRLTGNAYYDAEVYFVTTRDITDVEFGGPVDNLVDPPSGLVVTVRVFGELAFRVIEPTTLLARLLGTGAHVDADDEVSDWVTDQTLASIRAVLPGIVGEHGVIAMGELQAATAKAVLAHVNERLAAYGLEVTAFGELNVNLPDADAQQLKQFAATKAYSGLAGSFDAGVRGQAALRIAEGVASGATGASNGILAGMMMGLPVAPTPGPGVAQVPGSGVAQATAPPTAATRFCAQCGSAIAPGSHFCAHCGTAVPTP